MLLININPDAIMLIAFVPVGLSLIFFSRGILIFLTTLCLMVTQSQFTAIRTVTVYLRWAFFILFSFHIFGDILLGRTVRRIKVFDIFATIFIIYAFLSALYSPYPKVTLERSATILLLYVSVFWIIWKYAYDQGPQKVVNLILQVAMFIFIVSYLMIIFFPHRAFFASRFQGIFENPNSMGLICAILLPLAFWQFLETRKKSALFLLFLMLGGSLLSASRTSINAVIFSLGYFIYKRTGKYRPLVFFSFLSLASVLAWIIESLSQHFFSAYFRFGTLPTGGGRLEIWPYALALIKDNPLFGYGFGVEDRIFKLKGIMLSGRYPSYVHNSYLGLMLQLGILGVIFFFAPLLTLLFKELFSKQNSETPLLRYALQASLIAGLLCAIFESWIYSVGNSQAFPFWNIVMLLVFYRYQDMARTMADSA
jgi:O-antigen ligase